MTVRRTTRRDLAKSAGAVVVKHGRNLGKGAALKTGLSLALKQGYEWAVTLDGDGQHAPEDLPALLRCAEQTGARLVIGNRMDNARAMPWLRRQVNRWMSGQLSRRAGRPLPDTQSGFRLIHLETWAALPLKTEHFEVESEILMAFLAGGAAGRVCSDPRHPQRSKKPHPSGGRFVALVEMVAEFRSHLDGTSSGGFNLPGIPAGRHPNRNAPLGKQGGNSRRLTWRDSRHISRWRQCNRFGRPP